MSLLQNNSYAHWRIQSGLVQMLRDDDDSPPERLLQAIWQHQRLRRDQLKTLDGMNIRVLHPGFGNAECGPDFRDAVIQIGNDAPRSGDVEVDIRTTGWRAHGHDKNPNFKNVILHAVWNNNHTSKTESGLPTLPLKGVLDAPLADLNLWLERENTKSLPTNLRGKCSAPLRDLSGEQLGALLREAAQVRFQVKAAQFRARARHAGWEQALWEGLFRALGYKQNVWAMHCLAEIRSRCAAGAESLLSWQSRLLGISGLLPPELSRARSSSDRYVRRAWDCWWRERGEFEDCALPRSIWRLHGQRPANHPQRRLALLSHWLLADDIPAKLQAWCATDVRDAALLRSLFDILYVERDDFWSWHWTIRSARLDKAQPLIGEKRVTDLAVNVILPWLSARANEGGNRKLTGEIEHRYFAWPAAEDNAVLRLARERLLGGPSKQAAKNAAAQQGLMQIVRDFCDHSNAVCEDCRFPELVRRWNR